MDFDNSKRAEIYIQKNTLESYDDFINPLSIPSYEYEFYDPVNYKEYWVGNEQYPDELLSVNLM